MENLFIASLYRLYLGGIGMSNPCKDDVIGSTQSSFSNVIGRLVESTFAIISACNKKQYELDSNAYALGNLNLISKSFARVGRCCLSEPEKTQQAYSRLMSDYMSLWTRACLRMSGLDVTPVITPQKHDKRFEDSRWVEYQAFDFMKQFYLITTKWIEDLIANTDSLDKQTKVQSLFYVKQLLDALAPSNYVFTNPELLHISIQRNAENIALGLEKLVEDINSGNGILKIRQSEDQAFEIGMNIANTPGIVISQNDICQVIQYKPTTSSNLKRPLLIIPPWINKFYILDLSSEKSFVKWCLDQGHTVFLVSWVNPMNSTSHSFEDYMKQGIFDTIDIIEKVTGESEINTAGYCVGGTLLAVALGYAPIIGDSRIQSATLLTTQVDFTKAGILGAILDLDQIELVESIMEKNGYLEGNRLGSLFTMIKANELFWPYFIKNYLLGEEPPAFNVLHWNSDCTNIPAVNHSFYMRNCYLENKLAVGQMEIFGKKIDLSAIKISTYHLATKNDHIAPAVSVFTGLPCFGGNVEFVLSDSGHIAGVINPPSKNKYQYWTSKIPIGDYDEWCSKATATPGSWWTHWQKWVTSLNSERVEGRDKDYARISYIEKAPGSYVKVRC